MIPFYALLAGQNPFQMRRQVSEKTLFFKSTLPNRISPAESRFPERRQIKKHALRGIFAAQFFYSGKSVSVFLLMVLFCPPK
ncbi:MAG TPA: hypothetical protein PLU75_02760 [Oscillospiraceae bacterium]|nr:hypothetical protein [Oscillospiraceae bacterium]HRW56901.1 hypothetical protein [Oscillospiraceae bacterium]